jgi:hypothetical protein
MNKILLTLFLLILSPMCIAEIMFDDFAKTTLIDTPLPQTNLEYDYSGTAKLPIKMKLVKDYGSEKDVYEGQKLKLNVIKDVIYNKKVVIKKGTDATAKVSVLISTGMNGIPASVMLNDFMIEDVDSKQLCDDFELFGQDRSLLVFPLKWALTILPPTGSLTNFIMGGHARLKPSKTITIYYYPEWK